MTDFWGYRTPDYVVGARVQKVAFRDRVPVYGKITAVSEESDTSIYVLEDDYTKPRLYHYTHWQVISKPSTNAAAAHLLEGNLSIERKRQSKKGLTLGTLRTLHGHSSYGRSYMMDLEQGTVQAVSSESIGETLRPQPAYVPPEPTPPRREHLAQQMAELQRAMRATQLPTQAPSYTMHPPGITRSIEMERIARQIQQNSRTGGTSLYGISDDPSD